MPETDRGQSGRGTQEAGATPAHAPWRGVDRKPRQAGFRDFNKLYFKIGRGRYGKTHFVPDDKAARAWLVALLHCGMSTAAAEKAAPWLEPGELDALKRWARSISFDEIGPLIKLTFAEWEHHKAWRFWPCDKSRQEVREWMKQRRADNEQKRKDDACYWQRRLSVAERRDDFVRRKLAKGATTLPKLYQSARHSPAFWPLGSWPSGMSFLKKGQAQRLRTAVHTVVNRMERRGEVETCIGHGVRRVHLSPDFNVETRLAKRTKKLSFSFSRKGYTPKMAKAQQPQSLNPDFEKRGRGRFARQKPSASHATPTPSPTALPPHQKTPLSLHDEPDDRAVLTNRRRGSRQQQ